MTISTTVLKEYLQKQMHPGDLDSFQNDTALFSSGLLDSFHLVELVSFIESEAEIRIKPMEVNLHNLDSVNQILDFVTKKTEEQKKS